jgi:prepilin-type N-terminal cleavage/methylation domain-containing protein
MNPKGLTLIEVMVAMSVLLVALTAFGSLTVSNLRQNQVSGSRTQAVQIMNYLGRRVTGADSAVTPTSTATPLIWNYGALRSAFPDLSQTGNPDVYRAKVTNNGQWNGAGVTVAQFRVEVCWRSPGGETCVRSDTLAADPTVTPAASTNPDLGN